jgi:chorismate synthase
MVNRDEPKHPILPHEEGVDIGNGFNNSSVDGSSNHNLVAF